MVLLLPRAKKGGLFGNFSWPNESFVNMTRKKHVIGSTSFFKMEASFPGGISFYLFRKGGMDRILPLSGRERREKDSSTSNWKELHPLPEGIKFFILFRKGREHNGPRSFILFPREEPAFHSFPPEENGAHPLPDGRNFIFFRNGQGILFLPERDLPGRFHTLRPERTPVAYSLSARKRGSSTHMKGISASSGRYLLGYSSGSEQVHPLSEGTS